MMPLETNFIAVGQLGRLVVDTNLQVWVAIARLNQDTAAYEFHIEFDPLLKPDQLWIPKIKNGIQLLVNNGKGPFANLTRFRSSQCRDIARFSYEFPLGWKGDFNLRFSKTDLKSSISLIAQFGPQEAKAEPYAFYLNALRATILMGYEADFDKEGESIRVLIKHSIANIFSRETGEAFEPFDADYAVLGSRPARTRDNR